MAAYAAFNDSEPTPKIPLPDNMVTQARVYPPITTIPYPKSNMEENKIIEIRTPILSMKIPPKKGNIILGSE